MRSRRCSIQCAGLLAAFFAAGCGDEFVTLDEGDEGDGCRALRFQGAQHAEVPFASAFDLAAPFTVEARFRVELAGEAFPNEMHILSHHTHGGGAGWVLMTDDNQAHFRMYCNGTNVWQSGGEVVDGRWHHIAGVTDGTRARLYLDGRLVAEQESHNPDVSLTPRPYDGPLRIGRDASSNGFPFRGLIDEARLSTTLRYVADFDVPAGVAPLDDATVALWRFEEGDGQVIEDATGRHPGTLGGSTEEEFTDPEREDGHCLEAIQPAR